MKRSTKPKWDEVSSGEQARYVERVENLIKRGYLPKTTDVNDAAKRMYVHYTEDVFRDDYDPKKMEDGTIFSSKKV